MLFRRPARVEENSEPRHAVNGNNEANLLTRHVAGDVSAFPELVGIFRAQIYSYLVRVGVSESMRDDLFQEIFLSIHRNAASFDQSRELRPWIFTVAANKVRDHFRKQKTIRESAQEELPEQVVEDANGDAIASAKQTAEFVNEEMLKLPLEQREAVSLCALKGLEQEEVAKILNCPVNTVKTHLRRAREKLSKALLMRNAKFERESSAGGMDTLSRIKSEVTP